MADLYLISSRLFVRSLSGRALLILSSVRPSIALAILEQAQSEFGVEEAAIRLGQITSTRMQPIPDILLFPEFI